MLFRSITVFNAASQLPAPIVGFTSSELIANAGGDFIVTPGAPIHHAEITVSGSPGTRNCVVLGAGLTGGAQTVLRFQLPAVDGINLRIFDQSLSGALITTITSQADGFLPSSRMQLWFDSANWKRDSLIQPAFGQQS